ncbi:hypothetical protein [Jannaschia seohaensis]|uniref:hypothetical protein n=1 Tax=Jannaschia seohaensis TaxID=475081 RepID=UPI0011B211D4|nr:hypothetical protein [Jannaschia seohaensis]
MRTGHRTFAKAALVICIMLSMALSSLPDTAEAMGGVSKQVHLHDHADAHPAYAEDENAAVDRHCHPGLDCQTVSVFLNDPWLEIQLAEFDHRFALTRSDGQSVTIPFDLPPPRNGS